MVAGIVFQLRVLLILGICSSQWAAALEVAFFIKRNSSGEVESYDPESPYSHVAIRVGNEWLDARPWWGVSLHSDFSTLGEIAELLVDPFTPEPDEAFLETVLGKKYFLFADWDDPEVFNCTKLVAKYLGIPPNPMNFDTALWGGRFEEYLGKPGLSPGELRTRLIEEDYTSIEMKRSCLRALAGV